MSPEKNGAVVRKSGRHPDVAYPITPGELLSFLIEPARWHHDELREDDHQEHDGELGNHERNDPSGDFVHADLAHTRHGVKHGAHRRGNQANGVVDDEQHAEVHRVNPCGNHHRHQHRGQQQNGGRHVECGSHHHRQQHDGGHQQPGAAKQGLQQFHDL